MNFSLFSALRPAKYPVRKEVYIGRTFELFQVPATNVLLVKFSYWLNF